MSRDCCHSRKCCDNSCGCGLGGNWLVILLIIIIVIGANDRRGII